MERSMRAHELCEFLQVTVSTLDRWQQNKAISVSHYEGGEPGSAYRRYSYSSILAFLHTYPRLAKGEEIIPDLMERVLAMTLRERPLLTMAQAKAWLGLKRGTFRRRLETSLPSVRLGSRTGTVRIPLNILLDFAQK